MNTCVVLRSFFNAADRRNEHQAQPRLERTAKVKRNEHKYGIDVSETLIVGQHAHADNVHQCVERYMKVALYAVSDYARKRYKQYRRGAYPVEIAAVPAYYAVFIRPGAGEQGRYFASRSVKGRLLYIRAMNLQHSIELQSVADCGQSGAGNIARVACCRGEYGF